MIGSTQIVSARANTDTLGTGGVPIFLLDGTKVANDNGDLWDGSIAAPINITESGAVVLTSQVFTGSDFQGLPASADLGGGDIIANYLGAVNRFANVVALGDVVFTGDRWITGNGGTSSLPTRFFGISGVLTVPGMSPVGTPEPSSLLGFITLGGFLLGSGVIRKAKK